MAAVLVVLSGCSSTVAATSTAAVAPSSTTHAVPITSTTVEIPVPTTVAEFRTGDVEGFVTIDVKLDGEVWTVALADSPELRQQGLMDVQDLGDYRGMVFVFEATRSGGFWMKNTLIPLDIAFFDDAGSYVGGLTMEPCEEDPCPAFGLGLPYRFALEAPAGDLGHLAAGTNLEF